MAKTLLTLISQKQAEVDALRLGLECLLERDTHVNLTKDHWNLDAERGTLTRS
jgi:hypothetical protein